MAQYLAISPSNLATLINSIANFKKKKKNFKAQTINDHMNKGRDCLLGVFLSCQVP